MHSYGNSQFLLPQGEPTLTQTPSASGGTGRTELPMETSQPLHLLLQAGASRACGQFATQ